MTELEYDKDKVDEVALALLYLSLDGAGRAWKGLDWSVSDRLYEKGWIESPRNKNKSFVLTSTGQEACIRLFQKHFCNAPSGAGVVGESPSVKILPINLEALTFLYSIGEDSRSELNLKQHLDTFTGEIVSYEGEEPNARYVPIPSPDPVTFPQDVEKYLRTLRDEETRHKVKTLLAELESRPDAARDIRRLLSDNPGWQSFQRRSLRKRIKQWLESLGITPK